MATQVSLNSGAVSSAGSLKLQTNGTTDAVTIDTSQNVGLGVTPSAWDGSLFRTLQITRTGGAYLTSYNGSLNTQLGYNVYYASGAYHYGETGDAARYIQTQGQHQWFTAPSGTAGAAITFTQAMTLDASGNLGLGTTSPTSVSNYGAMTINGTNGGLLDLKYGNTLSGRLAASTGSVGIECSSTNYLYFYLNGSERARIDSSGNLGIGTTSPSASAILDAQSTTKGVRFPNMTTTQKNAISSPAAGLVVFDTTLAKLCVYSGSAWQTITSV